MTEDTTQIEGDSGLTALVDEDSGTPEVTAQPETKPSGTPESEAASRETPATDTQADRQDQEALRRTVEALEKRLADTQAAFHETRGELSVLKDMRQRQDPEAQRAAYQAELESWEEKGVPKELIEDIGAKLAAQHQWFEQKLDDVRQTVRSEYTQYDPLVVKHRSVIDKMKQSDLYAGLSEADMARVADDQAKLFNVAPAQPVAVQPPPAPVGQRQHVDAVSKSPFSDAELAWVKRPPAGTSNTGLVE